jgi:hypothetical protein
MPTRGLEYILEIANKRLGSNLKPEENADKRLGNIFKTRGNYRQEVWKIVSNQRKMPTRGWVTFSKPEETTDKRSGE